jgi:hypothetical protein
MRSHAIRHRSPVPRRQRGLTLFGLMFWAIVIGAIAYVGVRAPSRRSTST